MKFYDENKMIQLAMGGPDFTVRRKKFPSLVNIGSVDSIQISKRC